MRARYILPSLPSLRVPPARGADLILLKVVPHDGHPPGADQVLVHELLHRLEVGAQPHAHERQVRRGGAVVAALQVAWLPHLPHNVDA